jgi:C-terminal processing protease CtpA/Prc
VAFVSDRSGRDEIWISDPEGRAPKKITDLDNEKGTLVWTPDSAALLYTAADKKLYSYNVADGKTAVVASSDVGRIGSVDISPDSKWIAFSKQDRTLRPHVYIIPIAGGEERHISDDSLLYSETGAVWTADGRYLVFTSFEGTSSGIASQGGINTTMALWALSLRDQDRDPTNRDIDNEAQGLAAEAAARQNTGRGSAAPTEIPEVRIDWNGLPRRARQLSVPGTAIGGLTPSPEGHSIALTASTAGIGGGRGGAPDGNAGLYIIDVESGQLTRVPPTPENAGAGAGRGGRGGGAGGPGAGSNNMAFARDGRTLYFRSGTGLFAAPINLAATGGGAAQAGAGGGRGGGRGGRGGGAPAVTEPAANATARQVTYTVNIEVDRKALRAQVFNEGWRIMKNRFYDPKMHGADWNATKTAYEPLLDYLVDDDELNTVMMLMIGQLNASHTGVTGGGRGGRGGGAPAVTEPAANATARQVTYTVNIEVDRKALRTQVFNEGWRIMKNRFYDPKMHGADWNATKTAYEPLLDYLVDDDELNTVMMMMIGQLNASHTGVTGGGPANDNRTVLQTRHPGFDLAADPSGFYKVAHIYKDGPADHDYLKIRKGDYLISVDNRDLKTSENYWQYFTLAAGSKFHFMVNDKPAKDGAWPVTIAPVAGSAFTDLQYARWVTDRREMVTRLSNGEIGYLHIRAMDAPSLRQFQLDLAAQRTKKALVIDQRFNGGGGIDQELLGILAGRQYQYTIGRDAGFQQPRPQNFYGPMVVMQNERSASDAEMFPAGFKALGLGKVVGVPTMGAVIGTGSYTLLNGAAIRTPGSGVWTVTGQNMENYGVPPDVLIDNTPGDFIKGRDAQIEKAVEVLKAEMGRKTSTSQQ